MHRTLSSGKAADPLAEPGLDGTRLRGFGGAAWFAHGEREALGAGVEGVPVDEEAAAGGLVLFAPGGEEFEAGEATAAPC